MIKTSMPETNHFTFIGIGEVLFDLFEDGTATLGGALSIFLSCASACC
jgi:hypothetical protein